MKKQILAFALLTLPLAAASSVPTAKPEDVGVSSERLQRVSQMIQRRIAAGEMTGAVTIVARKGKIVHLEAQGVMDLDSKKPVTKDTMFRVASMTKPVTGVAIMMMIEEGKVVPVVDRTFALPAAADAVRYLEQGHPAGKIVVTV